MTRLRGGLCFGRNNARAGDVKGQMEKVKREQGADLGCGARLLKWRLNPEPWRDRQLSVGNQTSTRKCETDERKPTTAHEQADRATDYACQSKERCQQKTGGSESGTVARRTPSPITHLFPTEQNSDRHNRPAADRSPRKRRSSGLRIGTCIVERCRHGASIGFSG